MLSKIDKAPKAGDDFHALVDTWQDKHKVPIMNLLHLGLQDTTENDAVFKEDGVLDRASSALTFDLEMFKTYQIGEDVGKIWQQKAKDACKRVLHTQLGIQVNEFETAFEKPLPLSMPATIIAQLSALQAHLLADASGPDARLLQLLIATTQKFRRLAGKKDWVACLL